MIRIGNLIIRHQYFVRIIFLSIFFAGLLLNQLLLNIGIKSTGLDYLLWIIFFLLLVAIRLLINDFKISGCYLTLFIILLGFITLNFPFSKYINSFQSFLIGTFITIIFPLTYITAYSFKLEEADLQKIIRTVFWGGFIIVSIVVFERVIDIISNNGFSSLKILKTRGFAGTLASLNIAFSLFLYQHYKSKRYIYLIIISLIAISLLVFLKSIVSSLVIILIYFIVFSKRGGIRKIFTIITILMFSIIVLLSIPSVKQKIFYYQIYYLQTSGDNLTPRLLLYREAYNIANDHFPFGSGQGTYGSFPVMMHYNQIYYDYNLSNKQGLSYQDPQNFLYDSHWASVLGENGFISTSIYLTLFLYPILFMRKFIRSLTYKKYGFLVNSIVLIIFIESLALAIPYQISFILLYAGLTGFICRFVFEKNKFQLNSE